MLNYIVLSVKALISVDQQQGFQVKPRAYRLIVARTLKPFFRASKSEITFVRSRIWRGWAEKFA